MADYELIWRNKHLTPDARIIDDLIEGLQDAADLLRAMKDRGVTLRDDDGPADDYATLVTDDADVAKMFDFAEPEVNEEDEV